MASPAHIKLRGLRDKMEASRLHQMLDSWRILIPSKSIHSNGPQLTRLKQATPFSSLRTRLLERPWLLNMQSQWR
jgi:hypothetical protein